MNEIGLNKFSRLRGSLTDLQFICLRKKFLCVGVLLSHEWPDPRHKRAIRERRFWSDALDFLKTYETTS